MSAYMPPVSNLQQAAVLLKQFDRMLLQQALENIAQQAKIEAQENIIVQLTTYLANQQMALRNTDRNIQYTYRNLNYLGFGIGTLATILVGGTAFHALSKYFRSPNNSTAIG